MTTNGYLGNPNLKPAHYQIEYTEEQIIEYIKCKDDFFYYLRNYCKILSNSKYILFEPRDYQVELAKDILNEKYTIGKWARQSGKSTIVAAIISWLTIFKKNHTSLIAAHVHATAIEIITKVKDIIERLPWWLQQGVIKWNTLSIEFENGSRVLSSATTIKTGRGFTINFCVGENEEITLRNINNKTIERKSIKYFFDNFKEEVKIYDDLYINIDNNYEIMTPHGWCDFDGISKVSKETINVLFDDGSSILCSNDHKFQTIDDGFFTSQEIFQDNKILKETNLKIIKIENLPHQWLYDPINVKNRDNSYYSNNLISHNCLLDEFAFVKTNIADDFFTSIEPTLSSIDDSKMVIISTPNGLNHFYKMCTDAQEKRSSFKYNEIIWSDVPGRDEKWKEKTIKTVGESKFQQEYNCTFLGSSNTLIEASKLTTIPYTDPIKINGNGSLKIFKYPIKGHNYFISVDPSRGIGIDSSALVILDITNYPVEVVAQYKKEDLPPILFPNVINSLAKEYNDATVLIEINDNGLQVVDILFEEYDYDNIVGAVVKGRAGQQLTTFSMKSKGIKTSPATKRIGCSNLKNMIDMDKLIIHSFDIIGELSNFIQKNNSYEADVGQHDDLVMCLVNFAWASGQAFFKNYIEQGIRSIYADNINNMDEISMPLPILSNYEEEEVIW